jgi:hypothetical protein
MDKKYRTRNGRDVRIYAVDGLTEKTPVVGQVVGIRVVTSWHADGSLYDSDALSDLDLIEVQTAEDVVQEIINCGSCLVPNAITICQALRDAGKLRDGE